MSEWKNPFESVRHGYTTQICDEGDRLHAVKAFTEEQLRAALSAPGLQLRVRQAIEARLRKIERSR